MGLDMYLYKKQDDTNVDDYDNEIEVGYWRKANAIHGWIVDNVQDGIDECQEVVFPWEKMKELLKICKIIQKHPEMAPELLPTRSGFFFGSSGYNEWYMQDISNTIKILGNILSKRKNKDIVFYYNSSW